MFNMKLVFLISLVLFEGGSAICGAAPNMAALIIGRVIAGIGGSGLYVGALTYISVLTTTFERPIYLAGVMIIWGIGNVLGPVVGGSLAESSATWRWGFYINLPIAGLFVPGFIFLLPSINAMPDTPLGRKFRMQDWAGIVVFTAFCACFCMAGSFGGTLYVWDSGSEIALWVMTFVLFIAVVLVTIFHPFVPSEGRMMPVQFMRTKDLIILPLQAFLVAGSMMMSIFYTPLIFQFTKGDNALQGGVRILPLICMIVFGCLLNGVLMPKLGYYIPWYVVGNALLVTGAALMSKSYRESTPKCGRTLSLIQDSDYRRRNIQFLPLWIHSSHWPWYRLLPERWNCSGVSPCPCIRSQQCGFYHDNLYVFSPIKNSKMNLQKLANSTSARNYCCPFHLRFCLPKYGPHVSCLGLARSLHVRARPAGDWDQRCILQEPGRW